MPFNAVLVEESRDNGNVGAARVLASGVRDEPNEATDRQPQVIVQLIGDESHLAQGFCARRQGLVGVKPIVEPLHDPDELGHTGVIGATDRVPQAGLRPRPGAPRLSTVHQIDVPIELMAELDQLR